MKRLVFLMLTFVLTFMVAMPAAAALVTYTSSYDNMTTTRNAWLTDLGISAPDTTINFEFGFSQDQNILGAGLSGGLTITSTSGGYAYVTNDRRDLGGSDPLGIFALAVDEGDNYTFAFSSNISYFGFYMMDNGSTTLTVNYADSTNEDTTIGGGGSGGYNGRFLGLIFDRPVSSLYIPYVHGGDGEVGIDNIEFGNAVPIPGALWLLGSGLFGLVAIRRRQKKS